MTARWLSWRRASREERQLAWVWAAAAVATLVLRPLWLALVEYLPPCWFRAVTGIPCPTCGTTHAALALLDGRPLAALAANPLATLAGLAFLAGGLVAPLWLSVRTTVPVVPTPLPTWLRAAAILLLLAGWLWVLLVWG